MTKSLPRVRLDYRPHPIRIIRTTQLAKLLGVDPSTIWRWHARDGILPPPTQIGPSVHGWPEPVIQKWLEERQEMDNG